MLPLLQQQSDTRVPPAVGPPREALRNQYHRQHAPPPSNQYRRPSAPRRMSLAKPSVATASPRRATLFKAPSPAMNSAHAVPQTHATATTIETLSRIPREFFVLETSAVLEYPPSHYQATFQLSSGLWETVVFPALTPQTRQQVLYLQQALAAMRRRLVEETAGDNLSVWANAVAYTEKEWALHALCFHELMRQIQCICREQSELLQEMQQVYDAAISRLLTLAKAADIERQRAMEHAAAATAAVEAERKELQQRFQQVEQQQQQRSGEQHSSGSHQHSSCSCGGQSRRERGRKNDRYNDPASDSDDDNDSNTDDDEVTEHEKLVAWRRMQRRRRLRMRGLLPTDGQDDDEDDDDDDDCGSEYRGRKGKRASVVEENLAAARVQQAYLKYQSRKEANRHLQRQGKHSAALDIQRSYRGYRERQQALHRRAVATLIGRRRQQAAAVELLQANVRAYILNKRREVKHRRESVAAAQRSMLQAQCELSESNTPVVSASITGTGADSSSTLEAAGEAMSVDRFTHLVNRMSELATAFSFLHSRRLQAKRQLLKPTEPITTATTVVGSDTISTGSPVRESESAVTESPIQDTNASGVTPDHHPLPEEDRVLLGDTIRRAEDLVQSFRSVISELKHDALEMELDDSEASALTKATSTSSLGAAQDVDAAGAAGDSGRDLLPPAASFLFVDDTPSRPSTQHENRTSLVQRPEAMFSEDDDFEETHLDDVLWQASVFVFPSVDELEDEASAQRLLTQELLGSREQQKRYTQLKQLITDVYDTIVGRLSELPRQRLDQLVKIHASLALSFTDANHILRRSPASEYEPISAFIGRVAIAELVRDHYHCQLGLKHLVDAAVERTLQDTRMFMGLDTDVQRFHDFYMHERSHEELVFFCLCRLLAQRANTSRQPAFHHENLQEVVTVEHGVAVARTLFEAAGVEASMIQADAFVIEPSDEIYVKHLPSNGLSQIEAILRQLATCRPAESGDTVATFLRASNASQFHATVYNASAPRSPVVARGSAAANSVTFSELVDLLRRYRKVMRHFHAFIRWTQELFHEAHRTQRQQQALDSSAIVPATAATPLLEEAWFVATLLPYSLGAGERELRNVFHNTLKQRYLQRLMPLRVFVSVVLVLLRNKLLSVTSYRPLQRHTESSPTKLKAMTVANHRHDREEKRWVQLALQWRTQEQRFEQVVERLYAMLTTSDEGNERYASAERLLQWRNDLYELFVHRAGRENLERAQDLLEQLIAAMDDAITTPQSRVSEAGEAERNELTMEPFSFTGTPWTTEEG